MTLTPLLSVRHRQGDFFIADIFDSLPFKDDMASMEHPLFTLHTKKSDMRTLRYTNGPATIEMHPSSIGLPNIMDKDVILYCASVVMAKINAGEIPPKTIRLSINDIIVATNRSNSRAGYDSIKKAIHRLTGCMLKTSIKTGGTTQGKMFHLLESAEYLESTRVKGRMLGLEITLSDWLYNSLIAKEVLTIHRDYFRLRKPIERRAYEIARKHCGRKVKPWPISLEKLRLKTGTTARLAHFRDTIKVLAREDILPEYRITYDSNRDVVTFKFRGKNKAVKNDHPDYKEEQLRLIIDDVVSTQLPIDIPPTLLEDAKKFVGSAYDYYALWDQYRAWGGSSKARDFRGGFIGFCRRKALRS